MDISRRLQQTLRRWRQHRRLGAAIAATVALTAGLVLLSTRADDEAHARKSAEARSFEQDTDQWLAHERPVADFVKALHDGQLAAVGLATAPTGRVLYTLKDGQRASTQVPGCTPNGCAGTVLDGLDERSASGPFALVSVDIDSRTASRRLLEALQTLLAPLLTVGTIIAAMVVMTRIQSNGGNTASNLTERPDLHFDDVIGNGEAKQALQRVRAFMHDPSAYARLGATAPRGVLLVGPPGTGKTLLAKALAAESRAKFIAVDGSYFSAMYYGAGVGKVKSLFKLARKHAPCVLFIDEIDGLGKRHQGGQMSGGESELNRIINRILVEMDGFDALENVVVVGATNHEDNIDAAMRRPGRFDTVVRLALPTLPDRQQLFEHYLGRVQHDGTPDTALLARMTAGMSPADIANLVNKAACAAAEAGHPKVGALQLVQAIETQQLGGEVSPVKALLSDDTRRRLAYHEAGHALVGHCLGQGLVERVTIEPRGQALGVTYLHRTSEEPLYRAPDLHGRIAMMLAGREAEMLVLGNVSTGAGDDLKRASELAIEMVGSMGFSESFGLLSVAGIPARLMGPDVQAAVLGEARLLLEHAQRECQALLNQGRQHLDALAMALLDREVLGPEELRELLPAVARPSAESERTARIATVPA
jgi:cell division protease FtsH